MTDEAIMMQKDILVVDDDTIANFLIERIVQSTGMAKKISKAVNGQEALNVFQKHIFDSTPMPEIVLLDLNMPIMNGFEFLQAYQDLNFKDKDRILIILVTSSNNPSDMERAKHFGIKHYLTKPISAEVIKNIISSEFES